LNHTSPPFPSLSSLIRCFTHPRYTDSPSSFVPSSLLLLRPFRLQ
jgi:hypothetical protein